MDGLGGRGSSNISNVKTFSANKNNYQLTSIVMFCQLARRRKLSLTNLQKSAIFQISKLIFKNEGLSQSICNK